MIKIYTTTTADLFVLQNIQTQFDSHNVNVSVENIEQKINQKWLTTAETGSLLLDDKLYLIANGMKVSPNWQALQKRIVMAGKKSELLLKAMKLQAGMTVIDATAGFGHDSLILASTGAKVTMIEQNPVMFILLQHEIKLMLNNPNWQKLLGRLDLHFGEAVAMLPTLAKADTIYLDPMFPQDSYKSAVSKTMQVLHDIALPPSIEQEILLLNTAKNQLIDNGQVIVKRPKNAPFLANEAPHDSLSNAVLRFDIYKNK